MYKGARASVETRPETQPLILSPNSQLIRNYFTLPYAVDLVLDQGAMDIVSTLTLSSSTSASASSRPHDAYISTTESDVLYDDHTAQTNKTQCVIV